MIKIAMQAEPMIPHTTAERVPKSIDESRQSPYITSPSNPNHRMALLNSKWDLILGKPIHRANTYIQQSASNGLLRFCQDSSKACDINSNSPFRISWLWIPIWVDVWNTTWWCVAKISLMWSMVYVKSIIWQTFNVSNDRAHSCIYYGTLSCLNHTLALQICRVLCTPNVELSPYK